MTTFATINDKSGKEIHSILLLIYQPSLIENGSAAELVTGWSTISPICMITPAESPHITPWKQSSFVVLLTILQRHIFVDVEVNSMGHIVNHCNRLTHLHKMTRETYERDSKLSVSVSCVNQCMTCVTRLHCIYMLYMLMYVNHCMCHNIAFFIYIIFVNQCMFHKIAF